MLKDIVHKLVQDGFVNKALDFEREMPSLKPNKYTFDKAIDQILTQSNEAQPELPTGSVGRSLVHGNPFNSLGSLFERPKVPYCRYPINLKQIFLEAPETCWSKFRGWRKLDIPDFVCDRLDADTAPHKLIESVLVKTGPVLVNPYRPENLAYQKAYNEGKINETEAPLERLELDLLTLAVGGDQSDYIKSKIQRLEKVSSGEGVSESCKENYKKRFWSSVQKTEEKEETKVVTAVDAGSHTRGAPVEKEVLTDPFLSYFESLGLTREELVSRINEVAEGASKEGCEDVATVARSFIPPISLTNPTSAKSKLISVSTVVPNLGALNKSLQLNNVPNKLHDFHGAPPHIFVEGYDDMYVGFKKGVEDHREEVQRTRPIKEGEIIMMPQGTYRRHNDGPSQSGVEQILILNLPKECLRSHGGGKRPLPSCVQALQCSVPRSRLRVDNWVLDITEEIPEGDLQWNVNSVNAPLLLSIDKTAAPVASSCIEAFTNVEIVPFSELNDSALVIQTEEEEEDWSFDDYDEQPGNDEQVEDGSAQSEEGSEEESVAESEELDEKEAEDEAEKAEEFEYEYEYEDPDQAGE